MKTRLVRRDGLAGFDITQADHGRNPALMKAAQNCVLTNDKGTKRAGFDLFNERTLTRGMMMQRRSYEGPFLHLNTTSAANNRISRVDYPSLGYGFLRWHGDYQPTKGSDWSIDFRLFTGNIDDTRAWAVVSNAADRGATQWTDVRAALNVWLDGGGQVNIAITREGGASVTQTLTSFTKLVRNTDYHIGIRYTASTALVQLYIEGIVDTNTLTMVWGGQEWTGSGSSTTYPNWYWLNQLFVHRAMAAATDDTIGGNPRDSYVEYPDHLESGAEGMGVYEIRIWSASKDYSSASYPRNRPLTAAEIADSTLKGYWPCDDGGGGSFRNAKQSNSTRPILALPNAPLYVSDTGLSSGLGLEFAEGTTLTRYFSAQETQIEALGLALWRLFGDEGIPGAGSGSSRFVGMTVQFQIRTCFSKIRRPGNPSHQGYVFSVDMADTDNYLKQSTNPSFAILMDEQGRLAATEITGMVSLTDETVYTVTYTRSMSGATAIYLNAGTVASATGSRAASPAALGQALSINIGHLQPWNGKRAGVGVMSAFRIGWFRIWRRELTNAERIGNALRRLSSVERGDPDLLVNLEINGVTGDDIPSICSYPATFSLAKVVNQHHLGPNSFALSKEWWDAWPNTMPVFHGNHNETRSYDPVGSEGACELVTSHKSVFTGRSQTATVNHGVFHIDSNADRNWEAIVPEEVAGCREHGAAAAYERFRAVPAADRLFLLNDRAGVKVYTGRVFTPIGIPVPHFARLAESSVLPLIARSTVSGQMTSGKWYSYVMEYVDDDFNVVERIGPTKAVQLAVAASGIPAETAMFVGCDSTIGAAMNDQRPVRRHLNPRVTSIVLYRSLGSDSAADAELGPHLFHTVRFNQDECGVDTVSDTLLSAPAANLDLKRPPLAFYADVHAEHLILAGLAVARDSILPSEPGNMENFDETNITATEDGTGGVITGIKTAFGSAWLFKERSIWKIDHTGSGGVGLSAQLYTASVGCIAPHSITEFYAPESGQRALFFWSADGPYIFDGTQPRAIGFPLKGDPQSEPFFAMADPSRIYVRNIEKISQLWVFFPPVGRTAFEQVYAFDYLRGRWISHTGMRFNDLASLASLSTGVPNYLAGSSRGKYYEVLESARDGAPASVSSVVGTDIDASSSTTALVTTGTHADWGSAALRDLVVTVIHANGIQERRWVLSNTTTTIVPEEPFSAAPAPGDTWIVAGIDFKLEYPHDDLNDPSVDKHAHNLVTYNEGILFYRVAVDWAALSGVITALSASSGKRIRTYINRYGESLKLELSNPLADSACTVHAYGFEVAPGHAPVRAE